MRASTRMVMLTLVRNEPLTVEALGISEDVIERAQREIEAFCYEGEGPSESSPRLTDPRRTPAWYTRSNEREISMWGRSGAKAASKSHASAKVSVSSSWTGGGWARAASVASAAATSGLLAVWFVAFFFFAMGRNGNRSGAVAS